MSRSRIQAFVAVALACLGVYIAVGSAFDRAPGGVAAAEATKATHTIHVGGADVAVTTKPNGSVCYSAPHVSSCASGLVGERISYATGHDGARIVLAGVAGPNVRAVIARLSRGGVVWPQLRTGAFFATLPAGYRLQAIVKVLAGGRRVSFQA